MATVVKAGGTYDRQALTEARKYVKDTALLLERLRMVMKAMRETGGRPDYQPAFDIMLELVALNAKAQGALAQMWDIRQGAKQTVDDDDTLEARIADLEAQVGKLVYRISREREAQTWTVGGA